MKRGDVYLAELKPRSGSEQHGTRPVIVVSHDGFNGTPGWRSIIVVPMSKSPRQAVRGPTAVALPKGAGGLRDEGIAICHQVTTLDRAKLTQRFGALAPEDMARVEVGLKAAMDLI